MLCQPSMKRESILDFWKPMALTTVALGLWEDSMNWYMSWIKLPWKIKVIPGNTTLVTNVYYFHCLFSANSKKWNNLIIHSFERFCSDLWYLTDYQVAHWFPLWIGSLASKVLNTITDKFTKSYYNGMAINGNTASKETLFKMWKKV